MSMRRLGFCMLLLVVLLHLSCETDPIVSIPSRPLPVVYAILDDQDTLHKIVVEKSFGADYDPAVEAQLYDSLFFQDVVVRVFTKGPVRRTVPPWVEVPVYRDLETQKEPGYFSAPNREYFYFISVLRMGLYKPVDSVRISLEIPGYETITSQVKILDSLVIARPKRAERYVYLVPEMPYKVIWDHSDPGVAPHPMNEIDVKFEFIEELPTRTRSRFVTIQNILWETSTTETYREMSITYEEFIKEVLQQIPVNDSVLKTFLGEISIHIAGADTNLVQYRRYLEGYSDYNFGGYTNVQNGLGLVTSVTHAFKDSMIFDYATRQTLINENRLKKLKLSPWTEAGR